MCTLGALNSYLLNKNLKLPLYFILVARYAFSYKIKTLDIEKPIFYWPANEFYANHPIFPFHLPVKAAAQFQADSLHYYPLH